MHWEFPPFSSNDLEQINSARTDLDDRIARTGRAAIHTATLKSKAWPLDMQVLLGSEAHRLAARIRRLGLLPGLPRCLGGSAIKMDKSAPRGIFAYQSPDPLYINVGHSRTEAVCTPLLLATEPTKLELEEGRTVRVHDGYVFATPARPNAYRDLVIEHRVVDDHGGAQLTIARYELTPNYQKLDVDPLYNAWYGTPTAFAHSARAESLSLHEDNYDFPLGLIRHAHTELNAGLKDRM